MEIKILKYKPNNKMRIIQIDGINQSLGIIRMVGLDIPKEKYASIKFAEVMKRLNKLFKRLPNKAKAEVIWDAW